MENLIIHVYIYFYYDCSIDLRNAYSYYFNNIKRLVEDLLPPHFSSRLCPSLHYVLLREEFRESIFFKSKLNDFSCFRLFVGSCFCSAYSYPENAPPFLYLRGILQSLIELKCTSSTSLKCIVVTVVELWKFVLLIVIQKWRCWRGLW